ncbi:MAG: DUF4214 domain-containing protein, partial [Verrucomicrobia bacterium]|nr:DUF4214 domain-containing protein [Verrucomicrobiota bacterium]
MAQQVEKFDCPLGRQPPAEFRSLPLARAYIDTVQKSVGSLNGDSLVDALVHLARAYEEFPELELDRPQGELLEHLRSATENMPDRAAIPVLMYCVAASSSRPTALLPLVQRIIKSGDQSSLSAVLCSLGCREYCWRVVELVVTKLRDKRQDAIGLISEVIHCIKFSSEEHLSEFGDILKTFLIDQHQPEIDSGLLAQTVRSARLRLGRGPAQKEPESRATLLAMAERLRPNSLPARLIPNLHLGWPSGRISFDEFLLQWPCEIELPVELNGAGFIDCVYQGILLRKPESAERDQFMQLLQNRTLTRSGVIEELLASDELRSLRRKLRVVFGTEV